MRQFLIVVAALFLLSIIVPSVSKVVERRNLEQSEISLHEATSQQSFFVTVGAGFNDNLKKSSADEVENNYTLHSGDKLYVRAVISGTSPEKLLAGFLTVPEVSKGATKAKFSGALSTYEWKGDQGRYVKAKHEFNNVDDPLSECESVFAMFVDKDCDNFQVGDEDRRGGYSVCIASNVKTLRKKCNEVFGWYDNESKYIALDTDNPGVCAPIFNYSISGGLTPNASYNVYYVATPTDGKEFPTYSLGTVTADVEGKVAFACYNFCAGDNHVHEIRFVNKRDKGDVKLVALGIKAVDSKVYNISSTATPESRVMAMAAGDR